MHSVQVYINGIVVHQELCRPDVSIMKAHQLKRIYFIDDIITSGIDCGVCVTRGNGTVYNCNAGTQNGNEITIASAMNDVDFLEDDKWEDYFKKLKPKKDDNSA